MPTENNNQMPPETITRVSKVTITPGSMFSRVEMELTQSDGFIINDAVSIDVTFNIEALTFEQIKDFAISHAKKIMNICITDPHLVIGDSRLEN